MSGLSRESAAPFAGVAAAWLILGSTYLAWVPTPWLETAPLFWGVTALVLLDLVALAKTIEHLLRIAAGEAPEKRGAALVQAFLWASLKLACVGIFILVLSKGVRLSHLLGLGAMVFVPFVGGFFWSRRNLEHA